MPITKARSTNMIRRQSFVGKDLTFIEVVMNSGIVESAITPESDGSAFQKVTNVIASQTGNGGTLLAASYYIGRKATQVDESAASAIDAGNSIDVYQYIVEGNVAQFDEPASPGASTSGTTAQSGAVTDLVSDIKGVLSDDSTNDVGVIIRTLPAEGSDDLAGAGMTFIGMFDARGADS